MRKTALLAVLTLGLALAGNAQANSYIQAGYVDYDDFGDGGGAALSSSIFGPLSFHVAHDSVEFLDRTRAGVAFTFNMIPLLDFEAGLNYERWDFDFDGNGNGLVSGDGDESGQSVYAELQYTFVPMFRFSGRVEYIDVFEDEDEMVAGIGARIGPNTGPSAHITFDRFTDSEFNVVRTSFRWGF